MEYEKLSNEIDNSNEEGSEGDDQLPRIIYRSNTWTRRAVIGFGLLILIQDNCSDLTYIETPCKGPVFGVVVLVLQTPLI